MVLTELMHPFLKQGYHHMFFDNFNTSTHLVKEHFDLALRLVELSE